jgi:histone deacetylase 11
LACAGIFGNISVYILDMFNERIYPADTAAKKAINKSVPLAPHTKDEQYLSLLQQNLKEAHQEFAADIIIYNAGTDCLVNDPLGALDISAEGIIARDELVFAHALTHNIPLCMLLSGGYQPTNAAVITNSIINLNNKFHLLENNS